MTHNNVGTPKDTASPSLQEAVAEARVLLAQDWPRNRQWSTRFTLLIWRFGQTLSGRPGLPAFTARRLVQMLDFIWTRSVVGAELPPQVVAGPGLCLQHAARGVVIHASCTLGSNVVLHHQVTLGVTDAPPGPQVGDGVAFGAGAAAIGPIRVAEGTRVGTGAVLTKDTEPYASYGGVPAKLISRGTPPKH